MEYTQWESSRDYLQESYSVLILVVMEYTQWDTIHFINHLINYKS